MREYFYYDNTTQQYMEQIKYVNHLLLVLHSTVLAALILGCRVHPLNPELVLRS